MQEQKTEISAAHPSTLQQSETALPKAAVPAFTQKTTHHPCQPPPPKFHVK